MLEANPEMIRWGYINLWAFLPPFYAGFTAVGFWTVYFLARVYGKLRPLLDESYHDSYSWPHIGESGGNESIGIFFSLILNMSTILALMVSFLRYLYVNSQTNWPFLNTLSVIVFILSCFGMLLFANVPSQMNRLYMTGRMLAAQALIVYCWIQTFITLKSITNEKLLVNVRLFLSVLMPITLIYTTADLVSFSHHSTGYGICSEWLLVMVFLIYLASLGFEFSNGTFHWSYTDQSPHAADQLMFSPGNQC
ncbi:transmembrane protein 150C [Neosynchiropus ocellatus]